MGRNPLGMEGRSGRGCRGKGKGKGKERERKGEGKGKSLAREWNGKAGILKRRWEVIGEALRGQGVLGRRWGGDALEGH